MQSDTSSINYFYILPMTTNNNYDSPTTLAQLIQPSYTTLKFVLPTLDISYTPTITEILEAKPSFNATPIIGNITYSSIVISNISMSS